MNTPKDPGNTDNNSVGPDEAELYEKIDELEHLITHKTENVAGRNSVEDIPILDDLVDPESDDFEDEDQKSTNAVDVLEEETRNLITPEQLDDLIGNVDEKLSGELDSLVNILKDTIKDSIMTEIKSQIESQIDNNMATDPKAGSNHEDNV